MHILELVNSGNVVMSKLLLTKCSLYQLKLWDLRAKACVLDYRGHVNEITHGLPFYVDPSDSLIFAGKCLELPVYYAFQI